MSGSADTGPGPAAGAALIRLSWHRMIVSVG